MTYTPAVAWNFSLFFNARDRFQSFSFAIGALQRKRSNFEGDPIVKNSLRFYFSIFLEGRFLGFFLAGKTRPGVSWCIFSALSFSPF